MSSGEIAMGTRMAVAIALVSAVWLGGCSTNGNPPMAPSKFVPNTATQGGFTLSVFIKAPSATEKPDSIIQVGNNLFIGYQNAGDVKDGSVPGLMNEVTQYDLTKSPPTLVKTFMVPGHVDGLMARSSTEIWAMANEDGNPLLTIINLTTGAQNTYSATVNPPLHGGGFDDMQLINGVVYVSASNPTLPPPGAPAPTVVSLTLNANGTTFDVAPVLAGNAMATDITPSVGGSPNPTFNMMVSLTLTDPDSLATDPSGRLVLDSQADGKLVFLQNLGTSSLSASVLTLTLYNDKDGPVTPVDDTRWVPSGPGPNGQLFMLFTDATNTTYKLSGPFTAGDAYSCGQGQVMRLDTTNGHLTPVAVGIGSASALQDPHGMVFVTQ
jgi:hypothetical protein